MTLKQFQDQKSAAQLNPARGQSKSSNQLNADKSTHNSESGTVDRADRPIHYSHSKASSGGAHKKFEIVRRDKSQSQAAFKQPLVASGQFPQPQPHGQKQSMPSVQGQSQKNISSSAGGDNLRANGAAVGSQPRKAHPNSSINQYLLNSSGLNAEMQGNKNIAAKQ